MNYVGIDISKTSTAVTIWKSNTNQYKFLSYLNAKSKVAKKWVNKTEEFASIQRKEYRDSDEFHIQEIYKMQDFQSLANKISQDILDFSETGHIYVGVESYSQASSAGHLIDLVKLGTLIRDRVILNCKAVLVDFTPSNLKKQTCGLVYGWNPKGKKKITYETRNNWGLAGGNFQKHQMLEALRDFECDSPISNFVKSNYEDIHSLSKIPTPIDDLVDSYWLLKVLINEFVDKKFKINE
jgi:hypothetical protein